MKPFISEQQLESLAEAIASSSNVTLEEARQQLLVYFEKIEETQPVEEDKTTIVPNRSDRRKK